MAPRQLGGLFEAAGAGPGGGAMEGGPIEEYPCSNERQRAERAVTQEQRLLGLGVVGVIGSIVDKGRVLLCGHEREKRCPNLQSRACARERVVLHACARRRAPR